ncbi:MAG: hypothetical protein WD404_09000 [Solirubrobacterales bacterium]
MAELDIEAILEALVRANVEFVVIGGVAVGFHGQDLEDLERLRQAREEE